eukprot:COSAG02_NODE_2148_length_9662_cov_197.973335_7_plen_47_part_00
MVGEAWPRHLVQVEVLIEEVLRWVSPDQMALLSSDMEVDLHHLTAA